MLPLAMAGCSGAGGASPPTFPAPTPVSVLIESAPSTLAVNATATLAAAVTYANPLNAGSLAVTWSLNCGSPNQCGSIGASSDGGAVAYKAPAAIPKGATVTATAVAVANPNLSASATITIVAPIPITVAFAGTNPASLQVGATFAFNANITNDVSTNPQIAWTVSCGSSACGAFNPTSTANGTATTYTAPTSIPSGGTVTVTATSRTDSTKSVSARITITAAAATLVNGTYVYQYNGPPGSNASVVTGVLVASNGQLTGGEQDSNNFTTDVNGNIYNNPAFQTITGGSVATTADGNLQITIQSVDGEVTTLNGALGPGSHGFISGVNGAAASGTLELQSSTAAPAAGYAISLTGGDGNGNASEIGGILNVDSPGNISGAGSVLDSGSSPINVGASTLSAADSLGRVQIQLQPGTNSSLLPITLTGYIVDAAHIRLIETDSASNTSDTYAGVLGGIALGQGSQSGQYSAAAIAGTSYVFGAQGIDGYGTLQLAGVLTLNANGALSGTLNWNDLSGKTVQSPLPFTGTYTVDPTGRLTLTQLTDGHTFTYSMHAYLAAGGNALLLSNDSADTFVGQGFQAQTGPLNASSFSGAYGLAASTGYVATGSFWPVIGTLTSASSGSNAASVSGFVDGANGGPDFAATGNFSTGANGILSGTLTGFNQGASTTPGSFVLYLISSTQALMIETDPNEMTLGNLQATP